MNDVLTEEQSAKLLKAQKGLCYACGKPFSPARLPHLDHRHEDGLVRGYLCSPCNTDIGRHHDNAVWFGRVAEHLNHPIAQRVLGNIYWPGSPGAEGALNG